jgi:hypothetical protein
VLSVSENDTRAMIELSGVSSESDSCDDENNVKADDENVKATVSTTTLKKCSCSSSSSYSRVDTVAAVASINRSYNNDMNKKALQLQKVSRKK